MPKNQRLIKGKFCMSCGHESAKTKLCPQCGQKVCQGCFVSNFGCCRFCVDGDAFLYDLYKLRPEITIEI